ncbi:MAG: glycosyltransferase family 4 protein [Chloroflexota bacterium]
MKITIITTNGITTEFNSWPERLQSRGLASRGHTVRAFTYAGTKSWNRERQEVIDGVEVQRLKQSWFSLELWQILLWGSPRPDVVHMQHLSNQFAFCAALACNLRGIPVVITPQGPFHDPFLVADRDRPYNAPPRYQDIIMNPLQLIPALLRRFKPKRHLRNYLTHAPLKMADRIIASSRHERGVWIKLGLNPAKVVIAPNVIDPDWLKGVKAAPKVGQPQILYLGQLKYRKGFDLLARAIPLVVKEIPEARFIFAGHSPIHQYELLKLVEEGGVKDKVVFPGQLSDEEKAAYFLASDLYVLPTRYEGFGIPLLEAMSAGCPVVSTNIPVVNEIIQDGENGLLAPPEDPVGLAKAIVRVLQDETLSNHLREGGRKAVVAYYTPLLIDQLEQLYKEIIAEKRPPNWRTVLRLDRRTH